MKKSLLNTAVSIAMSGALLSVSVFASQAYADGVSSTEPTASSLDSFTTDSVNADLASSNATGSNTTSNDASSQTYLYPGMGVGAATGTVIAGPLGFLVGGLIGAVVGGNQEMTATASPLAEAENISNIPTPRDIVTGSDDTLPSEDDVVATPGLQLAQLGDLSAAMPDTDNAAQHELIKVLTTDLSLDVYFRSGSSDIETFYPARLAAIASLLNTMDSLGRDKLELHLDGYTDRRGNSTQNAELAKQRIEKVRQQLINAGVEENRINSQAFGEMKMVSTAGDLEGYTFDRKVVIRFERAHPDSIGAMTTALSAMDAEKTGAADNEASPAPMIAETGSRF